MARLIKHVLRPCVRSGLIDTPLCFEVPPCIQALEEDSSTWVPDIQDARVLTRVMLCLSHMAVTENDARALTRLGRYFTGCAEQVRCHSLALCVQIRCKEPVPSQDVLLWCKGPPSRTSHTTGSWRGLASQLVPMLDRTAR